MGTNVSRRSLLSGLGGMALASLLSRTAAAQDGRALRRPNIVFILADDLGYADVGCYGQKLIRTPNIDRLAAEGTRFTQCYAGSTVCAPSRCCLMTGLHTGHARIRGNNDQINRLHPEDRTVAQVLKEAGYATGLVGKWGLGTESTTGAPHRKGFDYSFGYLDQVHAHTYWTDHLFRNGQRVELPPKTYSHDLFTEEAMQFIRSHRDGPFFLYLAYTIPHQKFDPPTDEPYPNQPWTAVQKKLAAMITRMDRDIGRILDLLKELGLEKDTLVFFTSDNGPRNEGSAFFQSSGPLRGAKRDLYEGGIRVPMIARWPGRVKAGVTSDQVWAFWDVMPTLADVAGGKPLRDIDGISMLPALLGEPRPRNDVLYWEFHERGFQQAARKGKWKAVLDGPRLELFDLEQDPGESRDVAAAHPAVAADLKAVIAAARSPSEDWPIKPRRQTPGSGAKKAAARAG